MINLQSLQSFLVKAKKATYASGDENTKIIEKDKSKTLIYEEGDWKYHDNYFGGEPYGGREVVFFQNKPVYIMTYYGYVDQNVSNISDLYKFLQESLKLIPSSKPYRGPEKHNNGSYFYANNFVGEVGNFSGEESIEYNGKEVYRAKYMGGLVDMR